MNKESNSLNAIVKLLSRKKTNAIGKTTDDIVNETGMSVLRARMFVKSAMAAGMCRFVGNRQSTAINGRGYGAPCYEFSVCSFDEKKAKKKETEKNVGGTKKASR